MALASELNILAIWRIYIYIYVYHIYTKRPAKMAKAVKYQNSAWEILIIMIVAIIIIILNAQKRENVHANGFP